MSKQADLSAPAKFLIGGALFICLLGFMIPIGLLVSQTEEKIASASDSSPINQVVEFKQSGMAAERNGDNNPTEKIENPPETKSSPAPASDKYHPEENIHPIQLSSTPDPIRSSTRETLARKDSKSKLHPQDHLVFDNAIADNDLVFDPSLLALEPEVNKPENIAVPVNLPVNLNGKASNTNGKYSPKGNLHRMALHSKAPTLLNGLNPKTVEVIEGEEGTRITIPTGSLVFEDGTPCNAPYDAKVWEFYDFTDILLSGLTTMSDQGALQTGGMTYVELSSGGRKLNLADDAKAQISFAPVYETDSEFGLYNGRLKDKQILWSKVGQKQGRQTIDHSKIRVSMLPESLQNLSHFGNFVCFLNRDHLVSEPEFFGSQMHGKSFRGKGLAHFPNGASMLFDGHLEIIKAEDKVGDSPNRSHLETRFEGKRLLAYLPASNALSYNKIFLPAEGFPIPFISPKNPEETSVISYRKGAGTTIDSLYGEISFHSTKKNVHLSNQSYSFEDRIQRGSLGKVSHLSDVFSAREIIEELDGKNTSVMEILNKHAIAKGDKILSSLQKERDQALVFTNFNPGNPRGNPRGNIFSNRRAFNQAESILGTNSKWKDLMSHLDEFEQIASLSGDSESAEKFRQTQQSLNQKVDVEHKALEANLTFRREFLSPNLGWHNLDKLRQSGRNEQYELASNESQLSTSLEETNASISMGPFYFSVWPEEKVSQIAGPGTNSVPRGAFTSMGYFLGDDGRLFADIAKARTGKTVSLNFKEMDKEDFRKKVKKFL
jgi:hypothetical protein